MALQSFVDEIERLNLASERIEGLAEDHPSVSEALLSISGNVRATATILAVLVHLKLQNGNEHVSKPI